MIYTNVQYKSSYHIWILLFINFLTFGNAFSQTTYFEQFSQSKGINPIDSLTPLYGNGVSAADFDHDGDVDLYLSTAIGLNDRLYRNDGLGNFIDVADLLGIEEYGTNIASLWFDYDNDTRLDIFVIGETCINTTCPNPITYSLYRQQEDGTFINTTSTAINDFTANLDSTKLHSVGGLAAGDFNRDSYLDLVICLWSGGIYLLHNNGNGTFSDYTTTSNLDTEEIFYWQPLIIDIDNDGWLDIYCNVDYSENEAWINQGSKFKEDARSFGLHNSKNEMGIAVSDYNNDGALDMYVTNITQDIIGDPKHNLLYQRINVDNRVYYFEVAKSLGVDKSGWDWGTTFIDVNNDGYEDIATTNGWEFGITENDQSRVWLNQYEYFIDMSDSCGFNDVYDATTLIKADLDRDGDLDLIQTIKKNPGTQQPLLFYFNQLDKVDHQNGYLTIKPRSHYSNYFGIGSELVLKTNMGNKARLVTAGTSFYGQEPAEVFFGLAEGEEIKELSVKWSDGKINRFLDIPHNSDLEIFQEILNPPTEVSIEKRNEGFLIKWNYNVETSEVLVLEKSKESSFNEKESFEIEEGPNQYFDQELQNGTRYYYRMYTRGQKAASSFSNVVSEKMEVISNTDQVSKTTFNIRPNPTKDYINIDFGDEISGPITIQLLDIEGRILGHKKILKMAKRQEYKMQSPHSPGIYIVHAFNGKHSFVQRIIVL